MLSRPKARQLLSPVLLLLFTTNPAWAEKPDWTPIAELLVGSIGEADATRMATVMSRCTALNMILAGMMTDSSPDASRHYENEALRLMQNGVLIESRLHRENTGADADISDLSASAVENVKGMLTTYNVWLDDNMASNGSYFNSDFEMEMDSCQLASKLVNQMMAD